MKYGEVTFRLNNMELTIVKSKIALPVLILVGLGVLLWFNANRFVKQSQAKVEKVGISFEQKNIDLKWVEGQVLRVPLNIFLTSNPKSKITGASIVINYDPSKLDYIDQDETDVSTQCQRAGFSFNRKLKVVQNNPRDGKLFIARVVDPSIDPSKLPSGLICWGSIEFVVVDHGRSSVSFETSDLSDWEIVGPNNTYSPRFQEPSSSVITVLPKN